MKIMQERIFKNLFKQNMVKLHGRSLNYEDQISMYPMRQEYIESKTFDKVDLRGRGGHRDYSCFPDIASHHLIKPAINGSLWYPLAQPQKPIKPSSLKVIASRLLK